MISEMFLTGAVLGMGGSILFSIGRTANRRRGSHYKPLLGGTSWSYGCREDFTVRGWRMRNLMISAQVLAILSALGWWLVMP